MTKVYPSTLSLEMLFFLFLSLIIMFIFFRLLSSDTVRYLQILYVVAVICFYFYLNFAKFSIFKVS